MLDSKVQEQINERSLSASEYVRRLIIQDLIENGRIKQEELVELAS